MEAHIEGSTDIYRAERKGGICKHCKQDGDRLIIFFDNHNFTEGRLLMELTIEYPDPDYSEDGIRQEHFIETAPIQIVADNGDALDLRLPEPKVVERVVEKIVEKPVERVVEKVVEKVINNSTYTDLQKKAAEWVSRIEKESIDITGEEQRVKKVLDIFFKQVGYAGLSCVSPISSTGDKFLFSDVSSSDKDFEDRLEFSKFLLEGMGGYNTAYLFSNLNAPEFDLTVTLPDNTKNSYVGLFSPSTLNTITINAEGEDLICPSLNKDDLIDYYKGLSIFINCTAKKVVINIDPNSNNKKGYYLLSSIIQSNVECFDINGGGNTYDSKYRIDNIIKNFLPDVRDNEHQPSLIFRDYTGEATEELKQKVLDKGYLSVEFYKGDTKVL
jgi:hypothetical protein